MYIQRHKNKSKSTSIYVRDRATGKIIKKFGTSREEKELKRMEEEARVFIERQKSEPLFEFDVAPIASAADLNIMMPKMIRGITLVGPDMIFGRLFDKIGYNRIKTKNDDLFKNIVVTRLYKPGSKLRTMEYMTYFMKKEYKEQTIYRFLDCMCYRKEEGMTAKESEALDRKGVKYQVEQVTFDQTKAVLGNKIAVVFYDTTTLYFESREDKLRKHGWSKNGKNSNPQIVLGLLVAPGGNPVGYEIHEGNKYEGDTMIPIIVKLQKRFGFGKPIVVADAGLLSEKNIRALEKGGYEYILGARIKSMKTETKEKILSLGLRNGEARSLDLQKGRRLIISMSEARARKNEADREKGLQRLEKRFRTNNLTKEQLNNRGFNRFLSLEGEATIRIDYDKVENDKLYDGLKGYKTNCHLSDKEAIDSYGHLFMIERAFRMNKTDLDIRPIYHRLQNRIEAHVCICFTAYTIMLELERILKTAGSKITVDRARFLAENIYQLNYVNMFDGKEMSFRIQDKEYGDEVNELLNIVKTACTKK